MRKGHTITVRIVLNRTDDVHVAINTIEPEPIIIPTNPNVNQPAEPNVEIPLIRLHRTRRLALSNIFFLIFMRVILT